MHEDLRRISGRFQAIEEQVDDRPHPRTHLLGQAHDIGVAGEIGEHPRIEEHRLDVLRRQVEDEAARTRERMVRHARGEARGELRQRRAPRPEGEMRGGPGGGRALRAEQRLGDTRDKLEPFRGERRGETLARLVEELDERRLVERRLARACAISRDFGQHRPVPSRL